MKLDKLDKEILYELNYDCRQPDSVIAKKLLKSKQVIRYRIKRLESEKIISAYTALIDYRVLGFNNIRVYFKFRNISPQKEEEMYEEMKKNDLFLWSVNLEGDVDIAFYMWIKELDQFYEKWEEFFNKYRQYIYKQEFYLSINMIHYPMKILKQTKEIKIWNIGENKERIKIDEIDLRVLKILSRKANAPLIEIANIINTSAKLIAYRIKQLEKKKIILAYNAIIDETKINYSLYKVDFYLFNHSKLNEMYQFAKHHPNIKNVMKTIGGPDYEIEVIVKDINELRKIIEDIRTKFSDVIDYWRYNRFVKTIKQVYLPIEIDF
jgi:DNA-binding Lrp family transcriptional regulator